MFSSVFSLFLLFCSFIIFEIDKAIIILYNHSMNKARLTKQNKIRLSLLLLLPVLLCGAVYVFLHILPPFPCPVRHMTGFLCPGCGMSRALGEMVQFHFTKSILYNPLAVILAVLGISFYVQEWFLFFGSRKRFMPTNKWVYIIISIIFLAYCILRNMPVFSFLSIA